MEKRVENGLKRVGPGEAHGPGVGRLNPCSGDERKRVLPRGAADAAGPVRPKEPVRPERPRKRTGRNAPGPAFGGKIVNLGAGLRSRGNANEGNPREMRRKSSRPGD